ncbi:hypothetical protein LTR08_002412 [Meristemomyces frigidus]|nr:hypothetical protein LTR08_002412 [Meristemomyces frigidus]
MVNCILLAGAPESDSLSWDDSALISDFESPLKRFLASQQDPSAASLDTSTSQMPKWRAVSMAGNKHEVSKSTPADDGPQTQFLSFDQDATSGRERLQFLQQSLSHLNELDSSQIAPVADDTTFVSGTFSTSFESTSYPTTYGSFSIASLPTTQPQHSPAQPQVHITGLITDVKRISHADDLLRIAPQTVTINLLAAVISVSPARTVRLRKRGGEMDIIELLVGDDTRAGFSISFWLASADSQRKEPDDMRDVLRQLRAGDIVLLQNIALSAFKGSVYGQSLSRRFARNSTTLHVLGDGQVLVAGPVHSKYLRVREWALDFVGRDGRRSSDASDDLRRSGRRQREDLPPDTQT